MATKKPVPEYLRTAAPDYNYSALDDFLAAQPAPQEEAPKPSGYFRRIAGDTGVSLLKGAIGVPEAAVGLADLATGGRAGKLVQDVGVDFKRAKDIAGEWYSPEFKAANLAVQQAEGFTGKLGAALTNPSVIVQGAVESLPVMGAGGVLSRGVMAAAPRVGALGAGAIGEGVASAGSQAESIRQETKDGLLTDVQVGAAAVSGVANSAFGLLGGKIAQKMGIGDIDTLIAGGAPGAQAAQKNLVRKVLEGAFSEGVLEELPQSISDQVLQNYALGKPLDEGVDQAAVLGMLSGGLMGGGAQLLPNRGPLSRAANVAAPAVPPAGAVPAPPAPAPLAPEQTQALLDMANKRAAELDEKAKGTKDQKITGPDGKPVTVPGKQPEFLTPDQKAEIEFLKEKGGDAQALARAYPGLAQPPAAPAIDPETGEVPPPSPAVPTVPTGSDPAAVAQREADRPAEPTDPVLEGDVLNKLGRPFLSMPGAMTALAKAGDGYEIKRVQGGLVLRPKAGTPTEQTPPAAEIPQSEGTNAADPVELPGGALRSVAPDTKQPEAAAPSLLENAVTPKVESDSTPAKAPATPAEVTPAPATERDTLMDQAIEFVRAQGNGSINAVQGHLRIGYNRAARMLEQMEQEGVVGPVSLLKGSRPVLKPKDQTTDAATTQAPSDQAAAPAAAPAPAEQAAELPGTGSAGVEAPGVKLVKVPTVFGSTTYVRESDLTGPPGLIRMFTKEGKNNGRIQRENLDPTGEKRAQDATEAAANPLFNVITRKGGESFTTAVAATRELNTRGLQASHEVAPASELRAGAAGFVVRRKPDATEAPGVAGQPIDKEWTAFAPESGTKGIPRAEMPQVKAEHRGAMVNFLAARGITHEQDAEVDPASLKPTQAEFSPGKLAKAREFTGGDRSILVSSDGHVLDGHHQWMKALEDKQPVKVIRLDAPIEKLLAEVKEFPSAEVADGATAATPSAQFASYRNSIEQAEIVSAGMVEQIKVDERLNDGEAESLVAMAQPKLRANGAKIDIESKPAGPVADTAGDWWTTASEKDRTDTLLKAGWTATNGTPSPSAVEVAGRAWDKLRPTQRERITAARAEAESAPVQAPAPAPAKQQDVQPGDIVRVTTGPLKGTTRSVIRAANDGAPGWVVSDTEAGEKTVVGVEFVRRPDAEPAPAPKVAPGTRINGATERAAADRLEKLAESFYPKNANTPESAARLSLRSIAGELRKERTVTSVEAILEQAAQRLDRQFSAQADVVREVLDGLRGKSEVAAPSQAPAAPSMLQTLRDRLSPLADRAMESGDGQLSGRIRGFTIGMKDSDPLLKQAWVDEVVAEREKMVKRLEKQRGKTAPADTVAAPTQDAINEALSLNVLNPGRMTAEALAAAVAEAKQKQKAEFDRIRGEIAAKKPKAPTSTKAEPGDSEAIRKAKADLMAGLGDLAALLSKPGRSNILPEEEQRLLPILTKVMDASFRLGYLKFKEASRFVLEQIRAAIGDDVADQITIDHLQGAYIGMAGKYRDQGAERAAVVAAVESLDEITGPAETAAADDLGDKGPGSGPGIETNAPAADTSPQETPANDPATPTPAPAVDQPMAERLGSSTEPIRGAEQPRSGDGRSDDRGVRDQGGHPESSDDGRRDVGDRPGDDAVPDRPNGALAGSDKRVPAGVDFRPQPGGLTREGSWFATAARNIDLIELAIRIDGQKRPAMPEEQAQLSKYVGFGAGEIRNNLFPVPSSYQQSQDPERLIWPGLVREARWKPLAERMAALPIEWQRSVLQSTQYAHYTSENIVRSVWSGLQRLGFTGGRMLEPGMGTGNFAMLMPDSVRTTSKYTGIEFDGPTALIARLLSPRQNMLHGDFIKRKFPRDYFDVAIGNPPFSQTPILGDPDYEKFKFVLHDFFFAKSLDRVRPGGLLVFVTSKGTMDKQSDKARKYLADRADLLGAIRLPSTAFEGNAGTSVVTDVIFLRKRAPGQAAAGPAWQSVRSIETPDGVVAVNEYFAANPGMVLGQQRISGNLDDEGRRINSNGFGGEKYTVVSYDKSPADLDAKFAAAIEKLPANIYSPLAQTPEQVKRETAKVDFDPSVKREGVVYVAKDGTLMRVENGVGVALADRVKLSAKDAAWFKGYVGIRDQVQLARAAQLQDGDWETALATLNKAYDTFRKEHGPINAFRTQMRKSTDEDGNPVETEIRIFTNRRLFREDYDAAVVTQLESINESGEAAKSAFLKGRTVGKPVVREVKTIGDALAVSLDEAGRLDLDDVAKRMSITRDEAIEALGTQIYRAPGAGWQLADEYLSGDVVAKLEEAMEAARIDRDLERNIQALQEVQPEKLGPSQISVKAGASWVPAEYVNEFAKLIEAGSVTFDSKTESWQVQGGNERSGRKAGADYGTADRSPSELLEAVLNSRAVVVKRTVDKKTETDAKATTAAQEAMKKIREKFKSWIWTDAERATSLVEAYNKRFNNIAPRRFDGSHLTLPGVSLRYSLHPHQKRAIWRQIQTGNTYLAHAVGAGKTIEMIAGGMEQKRLGLISKPIYAVPNHMLEQFANEFMELYPLANIMVADDENFSAERRKAFVAAATLNAPDAIIITHSAFERIGVKEETVKPIRDEILADLRSELDDVGKGDRVRRSQLEQQIEAVTQRFDSIAGVGKKDSTIKFEDIGADFVYVDEAHAFRKLDFTTNQKVKGIDPNGSRRALDMYVKTRHLERTRPGRAMVFASGTAVTNTMGELFTIMRFFAPQELDRAGISTFDAWARQFGEVVPALEANAAGRYEVVERFAKFDNVPELMSRVRQFMDVLTSEHLGALVKRPDIEGGKPDLLTVEPTPQLKAYMKQVLLPRLEASKRWKPSKDEPFNPDPVIAITSDGRFAALDPRFFGSVLDEDKTPTKLTLMADEVAKVYTASAANEYLDRDGKPEATKGSTQIVFYNLGFGAQSAANRGFDARAALTKRLVKQGVKREHILWFDDANTDAKKESMFKAMRSGQARVLIGSAKKMGTGVNVQNRLLALHYFDPPWYPSDVEQPHGRIIRQKNQNEVATIKWYATKGTYDSTMWQMVARKQRFIDQAFSGDKSLRSMEDMSEASMFEQAAAVASGDPRAMQLAGLRQDVERLERLQAAHTSEQIKVRESLRSSEWAMDSAKNRIQTYGAAFKVLGERYFNFTTARVGKDTFDKQGEFGQALKDAFNRKAADRVMSPDPSPIDLGSIGPVQVRMHPDFAKDGSASGEFELTLHVGDYQVLIARAVAMGADVDAVGLARRIVNSLNNIETDLSHAKGRLTAEQTDTARLRKKMGAPFEYTQELAEKYADLKRLEEELRAEGEAEARTAATEQKDLKIRADGSLDGEAGQDTEPAFSRGADSQSAESDLHRARLASLVNAIRTGWENPPSVVVARNMDDPRIPEPVRLEDQKQRSGGATGTPEGFYYKGTVYLLTDQLPSAKDAVRVLFHEALGHYGLRGVFGKELGPILDRMAVLQAGKVRTKAREYGLSMEKLSERRQAAEEVLAELAQTRPDLGWVQKAVAAIRTWLRDHVPGFAAMKMTDDELIRSFILPARGFVERGRAAEKATAGVPAFQRDDKPLFSRSAASTIADTMNSVREVRLPAGYLLGDMLDSSGKVGWWGKTVGTPYNLAQRHPAFRRVFDAVQAFLNDVSHYATQAADLAPRILPKLESWRDLGKTALSAADTKAIAAPIFEGTLSWGRDEDGNAVPMAQLEAAAEAMTSEQQAREMLRRQVITPQLLRMWQGLPLDQFEAMVATRYRSQVLKAGVVWTDAELRSQFNLTAEQISLYKEFRAATNRSLTDLTISEMLRQGGKDVEGLRAEVLAGLSMDDAAELLRDRLFEAAEENAERADQLNAKGNAMIELADRAKDLMAHGYAPLSRFGTYTLDVVDAEGQRVYFGLFEGTSERSKMARQMRAQFPGAEVRLGTTSQEEFKQFAGVSPETIELFGDMLGLDAQGSEASSRAYQTYLQKAKSNRSALKRLIERKGIAGFSEDVGRVLAGFVYSNARRTSTNLNDREAGEALQDMLQGQGELKDAAMRLVEYVRNPQEEAQAFRGLLFAQYIGGSIASAIINSLAVIQVSFPYLSQYGGAVKAGKQMARAVKEAATGKATGDAALDAALKVAEVDGIVAPQEVHQLMAQAMGRATLRSGDGTAAGDALAKGQNALSKVALGWGKVFGLAEQFNRRATFIAAYRTAVDQGITSPDNFARKAVNETQFVYNKGNRPEWARGVIGSVAFTFKTYSISYIELLHRMATQGGPEGKKAALLALAVLFLMAGSDGLPFAEDLDDLIDGVMQRLGYNFSSKQAKKEFFTDLLGSKEGADFVLKGISGLPGSPIDVAGRLGMGNLVPATGLFLKKDSYGRDLMELVGPAGDMAKRAGEAVGKLGEGDVFGRTGALATLSPVAVRNAIQGADMAETGLYRDARGYKVIDTSPGEALAKAIGFQPRDVDQVQEASREVQRSKALYILASNEIRARWAKAIFEENQDGIEAARQAMLDWNEKNPDQPMTPNLPAIRRRVAEMRKDKSQRVADTAPKAIREQARQQIREELR